MGKRPRLFVSHHSSKAQVALHVEKALAVHGVDCWIAPRDVDPGEAFDDAIMAAIQRCDAVLLLFCKESDRSAHVKRELILADSRHKAIIPLRLEQIVPDKLAYHLANSQWIDWLEQRDNALRRIADKARQLAGPVPPAAEASVQAASPVAAQPLVSPPPSPAQPQRQRTALPPAPPTAAERKPIALPPPQPGGTNNLALALGIGGAVFAVLVLLVIGLAYSGESGTVPPTDAPTASASSLLVMPSETPTPTTTPSAVEVASYNPSFDCRAASSTAETLICSNGELAALDNQMAKGYQELLALAGDLRGDIQSDQAEWLRTQRNACTDADCLASAIRQRIAVIEVARQLVITGAAEQANEQLRN